MNPAIIASIISAVGLFLLGAFSTGYLYGETDANNACTQFMLKEAN